jgi:integrase
LTEKALCDKMTLSAKRPIREQFMNELQVTIQTAGQTPATMREAAAQLAQVDIKAFLENATPAQLETLARRYLEGKAERTFNSMVDLAGIDFEAERNKYIETAGHHDSRHTKRGYRNALKKLEAWAAPRRIDILALTPAQADDFIDDLRAGKITDPDTGKANGKSAATVRLTAAACSGFYTYLHRRYNSIENPFRGTKERPREEATRALAIPSKEEVKAIIKALPAQWAAAVYIMQSAGLRCGALPTLERKGNFYHVTSKGKEYNIDLDREAVKRMKAAELDPRRPFAGRTTNSIERAIAYYIGKLYQDGKIKAPYSCHDFRHFAACREYEATKNPLHVQAFLHHSSLTITERYLRSIGEAQ